MTTIHVDKETWKILNKLKEPGETMNDVINRILNNNIVIERKKISNSDNNQKIDTVDDLIEEFT